MKTIMIASMILMSTQVVAGQKYIFYLHGAIMEGQKGNAVSPSYGEYRYDAILDTFRAAHFTVISEIRKAGTQILAYAHQVTHEIDSLLKKGIPASNITVVGASKGAVIAMHVSTYLKNKDVNYVFLAACNDGNLGSFPEIQFYGNILSIYEKSDDIGESCIKFKDKSAATITYYKEIEINTGLQHGFLFQPLPDWMIPAIKWANGNYD